MAVDVENKYLFNGFLFVGEDDKRRLDVSERTDILLKLMGSSF